VGIKKFIDVVDLTSGKRLLRNGEPIKLSLVEWVRANSLLAFAIPVVVLLVMFGFLPKVRRRQP
jgi:hypothetical protein